MAARAARGRPHLRNLSNSSLCAVAAWSMLAAPSTPLVGWAARPLVPTRARRTWSLQLVGAGPRLGGLVQQLLCVAAVVSEALRLAAKFEGTEVCLGRRVGSKVLVMRLLAVQLWRPAVPESAAS
jgi:hypothetical protein